MHFRSLTCACLVLAVVACGDDDTNSSDSTTSSSSSGAGGAIGAGGSGMGGNGMGGNVGAGGMTAQGGGGVGGDAAGAGGMGAGGMGAGGMGSGGSGVGGAGSTVTLTFTIVDALSQSGVANLTLCDHDNANNCTSTNGQGQASITLPDADVTVDYSGTGYRPHLLSLRQGASSGSVATLALSNTAISSLSNLLNVPDDPTKGHIGSGANIMGAMALLAPMSGAGPFYSGTNGLPNTALTSTSSAGTFLYTNVNPGLADLSMTAPAATCTSELGIVGASSNAAQAQVEAGAVTIVSSFICQ